MVVAATLVATLQGDQPSTPPKKSHPEKEPSDRAQGHLPGASLDGPAQIKRDNNQADVQARIVPSAGTETAAPSLSEEHSAPSLIPAATPEKAPANTLENPAAASKKAAPTMPDAEGTVKRPEAAVSHKKRRSASSSSSKKLRLLVTQARRGEELVTGIGNPPYDWTGQKGCDSRFGAIEGQWKCVNVLVYGVAGEYSEGKKYCTHSPSTLGFKIDVVNPYCVRLDGDAPDE